MWLGVTEAGYSRAAIIDSSQNPALQDGVQNGVQEIPADQVHICKHPDGQDWVLGEGDCPTRLCAVLWPVYAPSRQSRQATCWLQAAMGQCSAACG